MPTPTYTPLATVTLGTAAASVTFSSIPATYRDLILIVDGQRTGTNNVRLQLNGDTGSNYSTVYAASYLTSSGSNSGIAFIYGTNNDVDTTTKLNWVVNLMDYSATDKHKTLLSRFNQASSNTAMLAHRWANTAAITSILVYTGDGNWAAGTTMSLYGIAA